MGENLLTGSLNWLFTSEMIAFIESSLANISSGEAAAPPIMDDICIKATTDHSSIYDRLNVKDIKKGQT